MDKVKNVMFISSGVTDKEFGLTIALVVFVILTVALTAFIVLLFANRNFRSLFFKANENANEENKEQKPKKQKEQKEPVKKPRAEKETAAAAPEPAAPKKRARRSINDFDDGVPTVPLESVKPSGSPRSKNQYDEHINETLDKIPTVILDGPDGAPRGKKSTQKTEPAAPKTEAGRSTRGKTK